MAQRGVVRGVGAIHVGFGRERILLRRDGGEAVLWYAPTGRGRQQRAIDAVDLAEVADLRTGLLVDRDAGPPERLHRRLEALEHPAINRDRGVVQPGGDEVAGERRRPRRRQLQPPAGGVEHIRPGHDLERQSEVVGAPRQRPADVDVDRRPSARDREAPLRHHPVGGFMAVDAAVVRRVADRAADVAARLQGREPGRQRRRRAARGAARHPAHVPRVVGRAVDRVEGLPVAEPHRHVGLAEDHRARRQQPVDRERVRLRPVVPQLRQAPGGRQPGDVERLLDRHRHPVQGPPDLAPRQRLVRRPGAPARPVRVEHHDGVEVRVEPLGPCQVELQKLQAADPARADVPSELGGRAEG